MSITADAGQPFAADVGPFATGLSAVTALVVDLNTGTTVVSATNSGVAELAANPGFYARSFAALDAGYYMIVWNNGSGLLASEDIHVTATSAPPGVIVGADPGVLTIDGSTTLQTFTIKRNDTVPAFETKLRRNSGATPPLSDTATVKFNMRPASGAPNYTGTGGLIHKLMTIVDSADAHVILHFAEADTSTQGTYAAEVEVTYDDGSIETFPGTGYVTVTIPADLDPGIDP